MTMLTTCAGTGRACCRDRPCAGTGRASQRRLRHRTNGAVAHRHDDGDDTASQGCPSVGRGIDRETSPNTVRQPRADGPIHDVLAVQAATARRGRGPLSTGRAGRQLALACGSKTFSALPLVRPATSIMPLKTAPSWRITLGAITVPVTFAVLLNSTRSAAVTSPENAP
jgi:hypothetical protein